MNDMGWLHSICSTRATRSITPTASESYTAGGRFLRVRPRRDPSRLENRAGPVNCEGGSGEIAWPLAFAACLIGFRVFCGSGSAATPQGASSPKAPTHRDGG
jgi:hypothetical protein